MNAVMVPYRSARTLRGCTRQPATLRGLAGSSQKRNAEAFFAAFPGLTWGDQIPLGPKFNNIVVDKGKFDELAGTWYGATFHPDGDQAGWQQKFDDVLRKFGAYNAYYGVATQAPPTGLIPQPPLTVSPTPTPGAAVTIGTTLIGYATNAGNAPLYQGNDGKVYFKASGGNWAPYIGPINSGAAPSPTPSPSPTPTPSPTTTLPAVVPVDQTSALIQQLMNQGASQQHAFAAAMQSLAAQGVQPTPQVQQQVANDIANASQPQTASTLYLAGGAAVLILGGILLSNRKSKRR